MRSDKDHIKNIFSSKLGSFEPELPPQMWEKIDAGLSAQEDKAIGAVKPRKAHIRRIITWVSGAAAVALLLLLVYPKSDRREGLAFADKTEEYSENSKIDLSEFRAKSNDKKEESKPQNENIKVQEHISLTQSTREFLANLDKQPYNNDTKTDTKADNKTAVSSVNDNLTYPGEEPTTKQAGELINPFGASKEQVLVAENTQNRHTEEQQPVEDFEKELAEKIAAYEADAKRAENLLADNILPTPPETKSSGNSSNKGFQLSAGGSGAFSKGKDQQIQLRKVSYLNDAMHEDEPGSLSNTSDNASFHRQKMDMEHSQPISFGIAVSKNLSDKVSLETGINYTYVTSKFKSVSNPDFKANDNQYFHYLGIPLSVNYKVLEWKKLQVYLSAGGQVQKDFYGRINSKQVIKYLYNAEDTESRTISQDHPQFSLTTSLGVSYPIYNKLSAFTKIGGAYYFDAKNQYETIYSDRKFIFNLNIGLKFGF